MGKPPLSICNVRSGGRFIKTLIALAAVAFFVRLGVSFELAAINGGRNSVFTPSVFSDLATYMNLAKDIVHGQFKGEFYYQPFYYAVFVPAIYLVTGGSVWAVIVVQSLLGALTAYLAGLSGAMLFGKKAGVAAAVLVAFSTVLLLMTPFHQNETLQTFNLALLFYCGLRALKDWKLWRWGVIGFIFSVAILTRGNIWLLWPGVALFLIFSGRRDKINKRKIAAALAVFFAMTMLLQLPFMIYNSCYLKRLSGPSTAAGAVLALGNTKEAPAGGRNPYLPAGPMEYPDAYSDMMARPRPVGLQMWDFLRESPLAFGELQFRKMLLFWDYREIPNNISLYGEGEYSQILQWSVWGRSGVIIALGLAGMLLWVKKAVCRRSYRLLFLYHFVIAFWCATWIFYILARFRAPILPELAVFAGGWLIYAWFGKLKKLRVLLLTLLAGCFISFAAYDAYRSYEPVIFRVTSPGGVRLPLGDGQVLYKDNGPWTFGGWSQQELAAGTTLDKTFAGTDPAKTGVWQLTLLTVKPGLVAGKLDDKAFVYRAEKAGLNTVDIPGGGSGKAFFDRVNGEHFLLYDAQRDYGRSQYNGEPLHGEWVVKYKEKK